MESGERLLRLASPASKISGKARTELETGLADIYTQIGKPVPSYLPHPPKTGRPPEALLQTSGTETLKRGTTAFITIESGPSWITIRNAGRQLNIPHPLPELEPGSDPYNIWKLDSLRITWDDDEFGICFAPAQIDNSDNAPSGFSHILMDLYIDMNHRLGSGLLPPAGKPIFSRRVPGGLF
ncbi:MAG: hypothetical protein JRL30_29960 [Deltaproteobacteria bacterium]|nr:hypothetical protein [Deltaproteobacteria bacterium]